MEKRLRTTRLAIIDEMERYGIKPEFVPGGRHLHARIPLPIGAATMAYSLNVRENVVRRNVRELMEKLNIKPLPADETVKPAKGPALSLRPPKPPKPAQPPRAERRPRPKPRPITSVPPASEANPERAIPMSIDAVAEAPPKRRHVMLTQRQQVTLTLLLNRNGTSPEEGLYDYAEGWDDARVFQEMAADIPDGFTTERVAKFRREFMGLILSERKERPAKLDLAGIHERLLAIEHQIKGLNGQVIALEELLYEKKA